MKKVLNVTNIVKHISVSGLVNDTYQVQPKGFAIVPDEVELVPGVIEVDKPVVNKK